MWGTHNMAILPPRLLTSFDTAGLCAVSVVHMTVSIWCVVSPMQIPFKWQTHQPNGTQFNCIIITDHSAYYMANYSYLWAITNNNCPACLLACFTGQTHQSTGQLPSECVWCTGTGWLRMSDPSIHRKLISGLFMMNQHKKSEWIPT